MQVFLIHGMGRTPASMGWLAVRLRLAGYVPHLFGYSVTLETLDGIAARFKDHIDDEVSGGEPYAVVGHSLGNIITRLALPDLPPGFERFVMLAPPNSSPAMARELQDHPLYQLVTRDAGQKLCDEEFYADLPVPQMPTLILAGTRGVDAGWHPLGGKANDAVVALDETRLGDIAVVEIPGVHSFLMNRSDVFERTRDFLAAAD